MWCLCSACQVHIQVVRAGSRYRRMFCGLARHLILQWSLAAAIRVCVMFKWF